jgi:GntR family transcriptional regulator
MSLTLSNRDERTLALRLRDAITALIGERELKPGDRLPAESELTEMFNISRPALREALKLLEQDGSIDVRHGKGRFVSATATLKVERPITCFESVTEMVRRYGYQPANRVLSVEEEAAPDPVREALRLQPGARVIRLERLRLQDEEVLVYCLDYIPRSLIPGRIDDLDWNGSLLLLLDRLGCRPVMSTAATSAVALPSELSERDGLDDFGPALLITEVAFTAAGLPVVYALDYHRGSRFSFSFVRK